jgi:AcrR family transcriptional regulator
VDYVNIKSRRCQHFMQELIVIRAYHHGNLRATLVSEGVKLIQESGVKALTLREISDRIGVSRTAAYRHFPDKSALLGTISEAGFLEFAAALKQARDSVQGSVSAKLDAMGQAYVRFAFARRPYFEVMFGVGCELNASNKSAAGEQAFRVLVETIEAGQASGEFKSGDPVLLAKIVWAMVHGIAMLRLETDLGPEGAGTRFVEAAEEILRNGLTERQTGRTAAQE